MSHKKHQFTRPFCSPQVRTHVHICSMYIYNLCIYIYILYIDVYTHPQLTNDTDKLTCILLIVRTAVYMTRMTIPFGNQSWQWNRSLISRLCAYVFPYVYFYTFPIQSPFTEDFPACYGTDDTRWERLLHSWPSNPRAATTNGI